MMPATVSLEHNEDDRRHSLLLTTALMAGLIGLEVAALYLAQQQLVLQLTRASAGVSLLLLTTGLVPAFARPGANTWLSGVLAVFLAGLLVFPFDLTSLYVASAGDRPGSLSLHALLRVINAAMAITVAVHLTSRFPARRPSLEKKSPTGAQIVRIYGMTVLLVLLPLILEPGPARQSAGLLLLGWLLALWALAHYQMVRVGRDADPTWRRSAQQARLLLLGIAVSETPLLLRLLSFGLGLGEFIPYNLALMAQLAVPITVTYAVMRHDLFGIDSVVRRALAYTAMTAAVLSIYLALTLTVSITLSQAVGHFRNGIVMGVLLVASLAFRPAYGMLQKITDKLFYPERDVFDRSIIQARLALQKVVERPRVVDLLTEELPARLDVTWASLTLAPDQDIPGRRDPPPAWNGRMVVGDRVLGRYWVGPRRSGLPFDRRERQQLASLVEQAALMLAFAETVADLNTLNVTLEQQVADRTAELLGQQRALAVAEERRRLARDLHDSVNQTLFSISLGARALKNLVTRDPELARAELAEQERAAQQALVEMRTLLGHLRAPLMDNGDFGQALHAYCQQLERRMGLAVDLETPDGLAVSGETAYEILLFAKEALHNAAKYAGVDQARCTVEMQQEGLLIVVTDHGVGFSPTQVSADEGYGLGLNSMRERIEALGGRVRIEASPGEGTRITGWVPIEAIEVQIINVNGR